MKISNGKILSISVEVNMVKSDDWKNPIGYYERAIYELAKTREELLNELKSMREVNHSYQIELQTLRKEFETAKEELNIAHKTANNAQRSIDGFEQQLNHFYEIDREKQLNINNEQVMEELSDIQQQLSQIKCHIKEIQPQSNTEMDDFKSQIINSISEMRSQLSILTNELTLISAASGMNYAKLRDLLSAGEWKKADEETRYLIVILSNRKTEGWLDKAEIERFPWQDLRIINRLWVEYSQGHFGYSIQKQIWQNIEVPNNKDFEVEKTLSDRVGWRVNNSWVDYEEFTFNLSAFQGHLPSTIHFLNVNSGRVEDRIRFLFSNRKEL